MRRLKYVFPVIAACALTFGATSARAVSDIGIGFFAGINSPLLQDDAGSGNIFGVRGAYSISGVKLQPYFAVSAIGDFDLSDGSTIDGGDLTMYGVSVIIGGGGSGISPYFHAGVGSYKREEKGFANGATVSETELGFSGGLGFNISMGQSPITIDARASLAVMPLDGGGSRKYFLPTIGFSYSFGGGGY